jgi:hypothetical protein
MADVRRFGALDTILLVVIVLGAAALRFGYVNSFANSPSSDGIYAVQDDRKAEVRSLVDGLREGRGFVAKAPLANQEEPTAHTAIGYPWLVSRIRGSWLGTEPEQLVRWIQCGLGALTAGFYFLFARRAFHSLLVGTLTGVACAVYPIWIFNAAELDDGTLVTFLLALCIFLGVRAGQSGGPLTSLLYGLALAGLACTRAAMLPFAVVAVLWFMLRCRTLNRGWLYAVLAFLGFVNGLIPWTARNYQTFHRVIPITDSAYHHLWVGNNPHATGGPVAEADLERNLSGNQDAEGRSRLDELREKPQPERYQHLAHEVWDEVRGDPTGTIQRRFRAGLAFFLGNQWFENRELVRETGESRDGLPQWLDRSLPAMLPLTLFLMLFLALLGWRWSYGWRWSAMPSSLAVMWIPLPYILGHAESFHGPRLPLDGVLLSYAALALVCLVPIVGAPSLRGEELERGY